MYKSKLIIFLIILLLFSFTLSIPAQEDEKLQMNLITMVYSVTAYEDLNELNFLTHIPIITEDSIPVYLKLSEESKFNSNVSGFNFKNIKGDKNLLRFTLKNCVKDIKNYMAIEIYTLKKVSSYSDMPKTVSFESYYNLKEDLKQYTQPSLAIQSEAPEVKKKAYELLYESWAMCNVVEVLKQIMSYTGYVIEFKTGPGGQTALASLNRGYAVCTGKANLAVALCRALGIPARVLHVLASHFIAQVWLPNYGWVRGESTDGFFPEKKHRWTVAWIADLDDENYAGQNREGVIAYLGLEGNVNAQWSMEYEEIAQPDRWIEVFASIEGNTSLNNTLFEKGAELWRLFCRLKNSGLGDVQLATFYGYQQLYFDSLVSKDIQSAVNFADLAIMEAKSLLNL
ncbi:MAG: transglutaminase family protein [Candidatus Aminicenantaceae bacterium]